MAKATYAEQIAAAEQKRAATVAAMDEIMTKAADEQSTLDDEQQEQFDDMEAEIKEIDGHIKRLKTAQSFQEAKAVPVEGKSADQGAKARSGIVFKGADKLDPGIAFARIARVKALAKLDGESVREVAKSQYGESSNTYGFFVKAPVPAGATLDGNWAAELKGDGTDAFADFVEYLRPRTIIGRFGQGDIPSLRRVPHNVPLIGQTRGSRGAWTGQGRGKKLDFLGFETRKLDLLKVANIIAVTEETIRDSRPAAAMLIRDDLAAGVIEAIDEDFIDPTVAGVVGVSPASITNGTTPIVSSGNDADAIRADIRAILAQFIAARNTPTTGVWVMNSLTALAVSQMVNPLGQQEFSGLTMSGGTFHNMPAIVSDYVPAGVVVLINASDIYLVDDGGVQIDMSREATLEMNDAPVQNSTVPTGATGMVSMWQTNSVAFRAERFINWSPRRASAVALLTGVAWGEPEATP